MLDLSDIQKALRQSRDYERERMKLMLNDSKGLPTDDYMTQLRRYHLADDAALAIDNYVKAFGRQREEA